MKKDSQRIDLEFVAFIQEFFTYVFKRVRLFVVLLSVLVVVFDEWFSELKKLVIRYMFWGRVKGYRFVVGSFVSVLVVLLPFILSRDPITTETYAEEDVYATVAHNDLLIEQGSSQTLIPKSRSRMDTMTYTVQGGDTLGTIAEQFDLTPLDSGIETLKWANDLTSAHLIQPGMSLKIPPGVGVFHKVKDGDSLSSVAEKYEVTEQVIADINWLDPPFGLIVGHVLFIPEGTISIPTPPVATSTSSNGNAGVNWNTNQPVVAPSGSRFLGWPVAGGIGSISGCYTGWHNGIDFSGNGASPNLVAAASGVVVFAGCQAYSSCPPLGGSGGYNLAWTVVIDHGNGFYTAYGHMNSFYVSSGQYVNTGQAIGQMGASGTAFGIHVHFMLLRGSWSNWNTHLNPAPYMVNHICGY